MIYPTLSETFVFAQRSATDTFTAGGTGLYLKVGQLENHGDVMKFACERFSCFPDEHEILFFGGETMLKIKGIRQHNGQKWCNYDRYMSPIDAFSRMIDGLPLNDSKSVATAKDVKRLLRILEHLLLVLLHKRQNSAIPLYIQELVWFQLSSTPRVRLLYDEMMNGHQWLECVSKTKALKTVDITNIAMLFYHSESITFAMPANYIWNDLECESLVSDLLLLSKMGLNTIIVFKWPSSIPDAARFTISEHLFKLHSVVQYTMRSKSKSIEFIITASRLKFENNLRATEHVELMIQRLTKAINLTSNSGKLLDEAVKSNIIYENDILHSTRLTVDHFCRLIISDLFDGQNLLYSQDIRDLILLMYAKPMIMNVVFRRMLKQVVVSPIWGTWNHVNCLVMEAFNHFDVIPKEQRFEYIDEFGVARKLSAKNWDSLVWNESTQHTYFKWFPQSVITRICRGLHNEYTVRNRYAATSYNEDFTKFCEKGLSSLYITIADGFTGLGVDFLPNLHQFRTTPTDRTSFGMEL